MDDTMHAVPDTDTRIGIYRLMLEARIFEQYAYQMFLEGLVKGTSHLATGQEAIAAGFAAAMRPADLTFCTYRGHIHTLLRGTPPGPLMAELLGRAHRRVRREGRLHAPHLGGGRRHGFLRHCRSPPSDRRGSGLGSDGAG